MMTRAPLLPMLVVSLCTAALTLAGARLAFPPASHAQPTAPQPVPPSVRAEGFELVDGSGTVRARLGFEPDGNLGLRLLDDTGQWRSIIGISSTGVAVVVARAPQNAGVGLAAHPDGAASF